MSPDAAVDRLRRLPFADVDGASVDHHRHLRQGMPKAIYGPGKQPADCARIVAHSFGGHEGDLIRTMRRLIDLLRQIAEGPEVPGGVAAAAGAAARGLARGIVLESALF